MLAGCVVTPVLHNSGSWHRATCPSTWKPAEVGQCANTHRGITAYRRAAARPQHQTTVADTGQTTTQELPVHLVRARQLKAVGFTASAAILGIGLIAAWVQGVRLPLPEQLPLSASILAGTAATVLLLSAVLKDQAQVEVHKGRLYIQWGSPSTGTRLIDGSIEVHPTEDGRGNGAFAVHLIPAGTYLGDYEGEMLDEAAYWSRYPSGVSDYSIRVDSEWSIDGQARASDTSSFSPCHMNHSAHRHNVVRSTSRKQQKVSFFTEREVQVGEELLLDYGPTYWKTREAQMLD